MRIYLPLRRRDAAAQGIAVAFFLHGHDARAEFFGDGLRAVGAAVVGDQNFAGHSGALDAELRLFNAAGNGLRLVEARHENGQFNGFRHGAIIIIVGELGIIFYPHKCASLSSRGIVVVSAKNFFSW